MKRLSALCVALAAAFVANSAKASEVVDINAHGELLQHNALEEGDFSEASLVESAAEASSCSLTGTLACDKSWQDVGQYIPITLESNLTYYWYAGSDNKLKRHEVRRMADMVGKEVQVKYNVNNGYYKFVQKDNQKVWFITRQVYSGRHRIELMPKDDYNPELHSEFFQMIISQNGARDVYDTQVVSICARLRPYGEAIQPLLEVVLDPQANNFIEASNRDLALTTKLVDRQSVRFIKIIPAINDLSASFAFVFESKKYGNIMSTRGNQDGRLTCDSPSLNQHSVFAMQTFSKTSSAASFQLLNKMFEGGNKQITVDRIPQPGNQYNNCLGGPNRGVVPSFTIGTAEANFFKMDLGTDLRQAYCEANSHSQEYLVWTGSETSGIENYFRIWMLISDVDKSHTLKVNKVLFPSWR